MQVFSYTSPPNILANVAITKHNPKPVTVGIKNPIAVHFQLFVSFLMERQVVEQGQWTKENTITHNAVTHVQLFATNSSFSAIKSSISVNVPVAI